MLTGRKLPINVSVMTDARDWFSSTAGHRVTATEIASLLGVSRRTATNRLSDGLTADDLITIARKLDVSPVSALVEFGKLNIDEVFDFLDGDGTLLSTASLPQVVVRLVEEVLPLSDRIAIGAVAKDLADRRDELARRRAKSNVTALPYAADSSDTEPEEGDDDYHDGP